jgi:divalent metal cation (Fe/Co/Zn/Cd) transporter
MSSVFQNLAKLLHTLPAILLVTLVEVVICSTIGFTVMVELMPSLGRVHPYVVLDLAILSAVITQAWILFNHNIRKYIKSRSA